MNTSLFLPKEIKVGFQKRSGTYTGKLAYVIYMDEKGVLRKEKSFESWRDETIETEQFANEPTSGFVLNKKAGGYATGWNHRQTYVRIYDPRGFEFEISVENLLYILDNTSSIIGKGLEGEFVYSWSGTELVLLPVNAPEYENLKKLNELRHKKEYVKAKDLKVGATYLTKDNKERVYLGKFDEYEHGWRDFTPNKMEKKRFYFSSTATTGYDKGYVVETFSAVTQRLIDVLDEKPHPALAEMFEQLETMAKYSPVDLDATERVPLERERFLEKLTERPSYNTVRVISECGVEYQVYNRDGELYFIDASGFSLKDSLKNRYNNVLKEVSTIDDVYDILKPQKEIYYLRSGKVYKTKGDI